MIVSSCYHEKLHVCISVPFLGFFILRNLAKSVREVLEDSFIDYYDLCLREVCKKVQENRSGNNKESTMDRSMKTLNR